MTTPTPDRATRRERERIAREIAEIDYALPGSIVERMMRCGSPRCTRCKDDPPRLHGPYWQWSRKVDGKTVSKMLSEEQLARYRPWLNNARRLRELVAELEALTIRTVERTEGWGS